jgi:hypothetical protein
MRSWLPVRDERGLVFPSPVVLLSIVAVAMAAFAFVATRGGEPAEQQVAITSRETPVAAASSAPSASAEPVAPAPSKKPKPPVRRDKVYVEVYNNSGIKGLASSVASTVGDAGWQVVGADNWYGSIPATTVYFPQRLERAAKQLALDTGIRRTAPSVDPMRQDRLTLILTGPVD